MNQENEIEVLGFWWILGHSEEKFSGLLKFSQNGGATLQIFKIGISSEFNFQGNYDVIIGIANSVPYTLFKPRFSGSNMSMSMLYYTVESPLIVKGQHLFQKFNDLQFHALMCRMDNTYDFWKAFECYEVSYEGDENGLTKKIDITIYHKQIDFNIDESFKGHINTVLITSQGKSFEIINKVQFHIESKDNLLISFDTIMVYMFRLRILFSIILKQICSYDELVGGQIYKDGEKSFNIYSKNDSEKFSSKTLMFDYEEVRGKFSQILENWFLLFQQIPEVINLFYNTYTSKVFYEYHFRDIYVALEGLYRWKLKRKTTGNIVPGLLNPIYSRRDALPTFMKIVEKYKIWGEIARKNRVYLTHLNEEISADELVDNVGLLKLMRKIQAIILFYFLKELGLCDSEIERTFQRLEYHFLPKSV
jgi:hypothetical protein